MKEEIENLEFTLTRSMTYTLFKLGSLIDKRKELLSNNDSDTNTIKMIDKEINALKEEFVSEFREENFSQINYYWYLRSKE